MSVQTETWLVINAQGDKLWPLEGELAYRYECEDWANEHVRVHLPLEVIENDDWLENW